MALAALLAAGLPVEAQPAAQSPLSPPANGPRHADPTSHTLLNATIHVGPGITIQQGAVVIRDGKIETVADFSLLKFAPPEGSRVWNCEGLHIYAGFIDPFVEVDAPRPQPDEPGAHWNTRVTPQRRASDGNGLDERTRESLQKLGFTAAGLAPRGGIFRGQSAVVSLANPSERRSADRPPIYREGAYQVVAFDLNAIRADGQVSERGRRADDAPDVARWSGYPDSQMGAIALIRQTLSDSAWQTSARAGGASIAPNALDAIATGGPLMFAADDELDAIRGASIAREFNAKAMLLGSGTEFRRLQAIAGDRLPIVLPLNFPRTPDVTTLGKAESMELRELMSWEQAPTNPRRLDAAGVQVALTTSKLRDRGQFRDNLIKAMKHGLAPDRALAMLTTSPAEMLGLSGTLGTIQPGKIANLVVADQDLFVAWPKKDDKASEKKDERPAEAREPGDAPQGDRADAPRGEGDRPEERRDDRKAPKIRDLWIDGIRHELNPAPDKSAQGTWVVIEIDGKAIAAEGPEAVKFVVGEDSVTYLRGGKQARAKNVRVQGPRISYTLEAKELFNIDATLIDNAVATGEEMTGVTPMPNGALHHWKAKRLSTSTDVPRPARPDRREGGPAPDAAKPDAPQGDAPKGELAKADDKPGAKAEEINPEGGKPPAKPESKPEAAKPEATRPEGARAEGDRPRGDRPARRKSPEEEEKDAIAAIPDKLGHPFGPYMMEAQPVQPDVVVITNATIWTANAKNEIIEKGTLIVRKGKIESVSAGAAPSIPGAVVIDAQGKHIAPGIIDTHSHTGISRGVNEGGRAVTAEVRIGDVTDPDAISWYRQLAGGVTAVQCLHGSANAIGGQSQTNKIRWGAVRPDDMHFEGAKPGIKFALGENPKQANWGDRQTVRYPQTRMGVESLIRDRFTAARDYAAARAKDPAGTRRNLELDALAEILKGERLVHCHSYRQDEILMLCRVAQEFGFKIGTFQHILEGYKVADEIAKTAIGASGFTDWWAFKIEVQDAIPQAFNIMREQGVVASYNSDSDELARRLNGEAAKALKYNAGGEPLSPGEAIKFVTLNAAIQLGIGARVGSLEAGKDADFAIWSGSPLSATSRCEATWVDGREYFSLAQDAAHRERIQKERHRLIQKALATPRERSMGSPDAGGLRGSGMRPGDEQERAIDDQRSGMMSRMYERMLNRGQDPAMSRCGECGLIHSW